ncbi:GntR family transcriptional regulator [Streptomyces griseorubiginosus]|uniref:D-xylose utilization operon transcriptional repressor n=1 Tax=Streptomyces griseorubiginosus TaxID=67304 RepID=A0AAI8L1C3_9ACTN|nr:GntR family transcriptional regulator [Streptomyces griseorubiginosus]AYC39825.1 putative D-xylose utilization operon transcriptional repressor [Streptomyces griseorubiginosus]
MAPETLSSLDRSTLRERALHALRTAILAGQYRPGDHLGEVELAGRLGISRGTVREALRHLQQEGLLVPAARGMLQVHRLSPTEVRELYEVRAALEGLAVAGVIASAGREQAVEELRQALIRLDRAAGDFAAQVEADLAFHLLLCELSGNSMLVRTWRHLEGPIRVTVMSVGDERRRLPMSAARHEPIVDAVERGDEAGALEVLRSHMALAAAQLAGPDAQN